MLSRPMTDHKSISSVALLLVVTLAGCSSAKPVTKDTANASPILERQALDLDGDSVPDSIFVFRGDSSAPGAASRIELRLSKAGNRVLQDSSRYDPAPEEFNGF